MTTDPGFSCLRLATAEHRLLIAATQPLPDARVAWEQWRAGHEIETADDNAQAIFSMVYANLLSDLQGPDGALLKGIYKRAWYANHLALVQIRPLLDNLAGQSIAVLLINDPSLVAGHYPDLGHRTIRSVDMLVRSANWNVSLEIAEAHGWQAQHSQSFSSPTSLSMMPFSSTGKPGLRIWANLFTAEPQADTDDRIWDSAQSIEIAGKSAKTLGPVEQLLCLSADTFREREPPLYRYADARLLVNSMASAADWTRLVWQAQRYEHILPVRNMLAFLSAKLSVPVPSWVLPALHRMAISHAELLQYHHACESLPLRLKSACLRWLKPLRAGASRNA